MGAGDEQVSAPLRAGAPRTGDVGYSSDQIEQWALATQPDKVTAAGEAYWAISETFSNSVSVLHEAAQMLAEAWKGKTADAALTQMRQMATAADQISSATSTTGSMLKAHGDANLSYFKWYFGPGTWWAWKKTQVTSAQANPSTAAAGQAATAALQKEAQRQLTLHNGHIAETYAGIPSSADITLPSNGNYGKRPSLANSGPGVAGVGSSAARAASGGGSASGQAGATGSGGGHAGDSGRHGLPGAVGGGDGGGLHTGPTAGDGTQLVGIAPDTSTGSVSPPGGAGSSPTPLGGGLGPGGAGAGPGAGQLPIGVPGGAGGGFGAGGRAGWPASNGGFGEDRQAPLSSRADALRAGQVAETEAAESAMAGETAAARAAQGGLMPLAPHGDDIDLERETIAYEREESSAFSAEEGVVPGLIGGESGAGGVAEGGVMSVTTTPHDTDGVYEWHETANAFEEAPAWTATDVVGHGLVGAETSAGDRDTLPGREGIGDDTRFERRRIQETKGADGLIDVRALDALDNL